MSRRKTIAVVLVFSLAACAEGQFLATYNFLAAPFGEGDSARAQPHPAVFENSVRESRLPPDLLNEFYKNPRVAEGLARASWFGDKEFPVRHRESEKIPREEIAKIVRRIEHKDR